MCQSLVRRGIEKDKLEIFYNWIDVKKASAPIPKGNFRSKFKHLNNKFLVAYAGNLGIKQGIDSLLKIAAELKNEPAIHFLIIGDGADKDRLIEISKDLSLINVTFISFLSQHEYFEMLEDLDISYVSQRSGTGNVFFPSKLLGIMAKSKPLLIAADPDSELFTFIQKNECGIITNFDDTKAQVEAVLKFYKNPNEIFKMGQNGFKSVLKYDRDIILNQFHNKIVKNQNPNIKP
jgi:colanic acid biosynthesis glycosyl transferase WcaI